MLAGVSSASLYPLLTEDAVKTLASLGVRNAEIFLNDLSEADGPVFEDILSAVRAGGMNIVSLHPFGTPLESFFLFGTYERRRVTLLDMYKRCFESMNRLGTKYFVIHGSMKTAECSDENYFTQYGRLLDTADEFGITILQENIAYCKSGDPDFLLRLREACGERVKLVFDIKQAVRAGQSPYEMAEKLAELIVHVHISDNRPGADCLPVGKGTFDFRRFIRILKSHGYNGAFIVELYRRNYGVYGELYDSMKIIEKIISEEETL